MQKKSGVMVLIDGVCGCGKSTVAKEICKLLQDKNFSLFDSDEFILENPSTLTDFEIYRKLGCVDLWHIRVIEKQVRRLLRNGNIVVADNFVTELEKQFLEKLQKDGFVIYHFILDATHSTVVWRVHNDEKHTNPIQRKLRVESYLLCDLFLKNRNNYPDAVHVATDGRSVAEIVSEIYDKISVSL